MRKSTILLIANTQHKQVSFLDRNLQQILKVCSQLKMKERTINTTMTKNWTTSIPLLKRLTERTGQALETIKLSTSIWIANSRWAQSKLIKTREVVQTFWAKGILIMIMKMHHNQLIKRCTSGRTSMTTQQISLLSVLRTYRNQQ